MTEQTLRNWSRRFDAGSSMARNGSVTAEQMELSRVRAENLRLKRERNPEKAAAYFAREAP
ncbi:MAG: hypothetical protein IPH41_16525 [Sulfuritalea sp.]|nr:hypothetical protein [Sulfuritalea sp.]